MIAVLHDVDGIDLASENDYAIWRDDCVRFQFPHFPGEFDIPDDWWLEAGMPGFSSTDAMYRSATTTSIQVALDKIVPPGRSLNRPLDYRGFDRSRFVSILKGMVAGDPMPPVELLELPLEPAREWIVPGPYQYRTINGTHRFFASIAAGYRFVPAVVC